VPSAITELCDFELSEVEAAVGSRSFDRGRAYARRGRVVEIEWDADAATLTGSVVGRGALYGHTTPDPRTRVDRLGATEVVWVRGALLIDLHK
jgi:hypothetical protein